MFGYRKEIRENMLNIMSLTVFYIWLQLMDEKLTDDP